MRLQKNKRVKGRDNEDCRSHKSHCHLSKNGAYFMHILILKENKWYYWAIVHFEEANNLGHKVENYYRSRLLGFTTTNGTREVVIQCSINPTDWNDIQ